METPLNSDIANNNRQSKGDYRFTVDNSSEANPFDWYNAYFKVDFQLVTLADSATGITTNGRTFIKEIEVECNGISVYNNSRANETSNVLFLLKYTKRYVDRVG